MPDKLEEEEPLVDMITLKFQPNFEEDYSYQRRYRVKSIYTFYIKELISAAFICSFSIYCWFDYIALFREQDIYWYITQDKKSLEWSAAPCYSSKCFINEVYDFKEL